MGSDVKRTSSSLVSSFSLLRHLRLFWSFTSMRGNRMHFIVWMKTIFHICFITLYIQRFYLMHSIMSKRKPNTCCNCKRRTFSFLWRQQQGKWLFFGRLVFFLGNSTFITNGLRFYTFFAIVALLQCQYSRSGNPKNIENISINISKHVIFSLFALCWICPKSYGNSKSTLECKIYGDIYVWKCKTQCTHN